LTTRKYFYTSFRITTTMRNSKNDAIAHIIMYFGSWHQGWIYNSASLESTSELTRVSWRRTFSEDLLC